MSCGRFERWLDEGCPGQDAALRAHADDCASCAAALAAALELERRLEAGARGSAPTGFTDRVMARLEASGEAAPAGRPGPLCLGPALPWWVRAAAEPGCVLAAALAGLFAWTLLTGRSAGPGMDRLADTLARLASELDPVALLALVLATMPGLWWLGRRLGERPLPIRR